MNTYAIMYEYNWKIFTEAFQSKERAINMKLLYEIQRTLPMKAHLFNISHIEG